MKPSLINLEDCIFECIFHVKYDFTAGLLRFVYVSCDPWENFCCCFLGIWILLDKRSFNGYFRICGKHVKNATLEILRKSLKKYYESNLRNTTEVKETQTFQF